MPLNGITIGSLSMSTLLSSELSENVQPQKWFGKLGDEILLAQSNHPPRRGQFTEGAFRLNNIS